MNDLAYDDYDPHTINNNYPNGFKTILAKLGITQISATAPPFNYARFFNHFLLPDRTYRIYCQPWSFKLLR